MIYPHKTNYLKNLFFIFLCFQAAHCYAESIEESIFEEYACEESSCEIETIDTQKVIKHYNPTSFGPEVYQIYREKKGGTKQHGTGVGIRFTFDHIKKHCLYVGAQAFYGTGELNGHTGNRDKIRSQLIDKQLEGSFGYTFQMKHFFHLSFTPYIGAGYYQEINKFKKPSLLLIKYTTSFNYVACGFISSVYINPNFKIGLNVRLRSPNPCFGFVPKFKLSKEVYCKVSDGPEHFKQEVGSRIQYRIELPLTYMGDGLWNFFEVSLVPFFEQRLYGSHENYPSDFIKTKFKIYGLNLQIIRRF